MEWIEAERLQSNPKSSNPQHFLSLFSAWRWKLLPLDRKKASFLIKLGECICAQSGQETGWESLTLLLGESFMHISQGKMAPSHISDRKNIACCNEQGWNLWNSVPHISPVCDMLTLEKQENMAFETPLSVVGLVRLPVRPTIGRLFLAVRKPGLFGATPLFLQPPLTSDLFLAWWEAAFLPPSWWSTKCGSSSIVACCNSCTHALPHV